VKQRGKPKRLSPYRRLELELHNARVATAHAANAFTLEHRALIDAVNFIDRLMPQSKTQGSGWTAADVKRLAEIRKLSEAV